MITGPNVPKFWIELIENDPVLSKDWELIELFKREATSNVYCQNAVPDFFVSTLLCNYGIDSEYLDKFYLPFEHGAELLARLRAYMAHKPVPETDRNKIFRLGMAYHEFYKRLINDYGDP